MSKWSETSGHILPLDDMYRPTEIDFWGADAIVAYVFSKPERTRPTRTVVSSGDLGEAWELGTEHDLYHDQSDQFLGHYTVVGIVHYDDEGKAAWDEGEVPTIKMRTATFK